MTHPRVNFNTLNKEANAIIEKDFEDFDFSKLERPPNPHCKDKRFNHKLTSSTDMKLYIDSKAAKGMLSQDLTAVKTLMIGKVSKDDRFS